MLLKTYSISSSLSSGLLTSQLHKEIIDSACIVGFYGLSVTEDWLQIYGDSMDESALDAVIAAHVPDYTRLYVQTTVAENKAFADDMMQRMKEKNLLEGLSSIDQAAWVHHRLRKVDYILDAGPTVQIDILNLVVSGDIETAEAVLGQTQPDDMTQPYHWLTQERINWIRNEIRSYLGWPLI